MKYKSICLIGHTAPDTDAYASMLVFRDFLIQKFKVKRVDIFADTTEITDYFKPLLNDVTINQYNTQYECAVMMDSPNVERLGRFKDLFLKSKHKVVIDHHVTNNNDGEINIVELVSSTCEIVYKICCAYHFKLSKLNQGRIYAGIITDTNNFTVGEVGSTTLQIASQIATNINRTAIYNHFLASNSFKTMKILSLAIQNATLFEDGKILLTYISPEQAIENNIKPSDYEGIINKLATVNESKLICFIEARDDCFYVSMRSKENYDVSNIAKSNGGGGHKGAAAFVSKESLEDLKPFMLQQLKLELSKTTPENIIIF